MLALVRLLLLSCHCAIASVIGLTITCLRPFHPDNSRLCAIIYSRPMLWILGITVDIDRKALHQLPRPCVFIANHQSNLDLFIIGGQIPPRTVSVGKKSLKWIPLFGQVYWLAGNILITRDKSREARKAIAEVTSALQKRNTSIWIFPEGTRNRTEQLLTFKKGPAQMAISAQVPIVPVCVSCYTQQISLNRWSNGRVRIQVLPAISTRDMSPSQSAQLTEHCQQIMQLQLDRFAQDSATAHRESSVKAS